ncbi:MAG: PDZ domain-containing protein, partial [Planctomycetota bacterium]
MLTTFTLLTALAAAPAPIDLQSTLAAPVPAPAPLAPVFQEDRPTLGVSLNVGDGRLVITEVVAGSAAEAAGLRVGDRIAGVGGQSIPADGDAFDRLVEAIDEAGVGGRLPVTYERDGSLRDLVVTVGDQDGAVEAAPEAPRQKAFLGVNVGGAAEISSVVSDSAADRAGLLAGDRILAIGDRDIDDADQLGALLGEYGAGDAVAILVERDGDTLQFDVTLGARTEPTSTPPVGSVRAPRVTSNCKVSPSRSTKMATASPAPYSPRSAPS